MRCFTFITCLLIPCAVKGLSVTSDVNLFPELPLVATESQHEQCRKDSVIYKENIKKLTTWAYQMWDSSAKRPTGQIHGLRYVLGDFDECLAVRGPLRTQYCLATLSVEVPKPNHTEDALINQEIPLYNALYYTGDNAKWRKDTLRWALCMPQSCPTFDISEAVNKTLEAESVPNFKYNFQLKPQNCQSDRSDEPYTSGQIGFLAVTLVLCIIAVVATSMDLYENGDVTNKKPEKIHHKLISIFSVRENVSILMQKVEHADTMVLHSMRFLLMAIVVVGHRSVTQMMGPTSNPLVLEKTHRTLLSMPRARGDLLIDSFLLLSALLSTKAFLSAAEKNQLSFPRAFGLRYFRLTPAYAYVIFFVATLFYKSGQGPLWNEFAGLERDNCQANWWLNLLHVNNYINIQNMCMLPSFYIPLEIHFFILSYPLNILLKKHKKIGLWAIGGALFVSVVIPFAVTILYDFPASTYRFNDILLKYRLQPAFIMYTNSHNRFGAYLIGMFGGYIYHRLSGTKRCIPWYQASCAAIGAIFLSIFIQMAAYPFFQVGQTHVISRALYAGLQRPAWAISNLVCILALSYGSIPVLPQIVSWRAWVPLSRLTYGMYITNMMYQMWDVASYRQPQHYNALKWTLDGYADVMICTAFAFLLYVLIESPCLRLSKELLMPKRVQSQKTLETTKNPA